MKILTLTVITTFFALTTAFTKEIKVTIEIFSGRESPSFVITDEQEILQIKEKFSKIKEYAYTDESYPFGSPGGYVLHPIDIGIPNLRIRREGIGNLDDKVTVYNDSNHEFALLLSELAFVKGIISENIYLLLGNIEDDDDAQIKHADPNIYPPNYTPPPPPGKGE